MLLYLCTNQKFQVVRCFVFLFELLSKLDISLKQNKTVIICLQVEI